MQRQIGFAEAESAGKKRVTKRQRFLAEMNKVVPWSRLLSVIEPYYPKGGRGRPPIGLERMLRIYFLQRSMPAARAVLPYCGTPSPARKTTVSSVQHGSLQAPRECWSGRCKSTLQPPGSHRHSAYFSP